MNELWMHFRKGIGRKLQGWLRLKSWFSSNYVSDWWEQYIYLRGRSPIMINSNYYGIDTLFVHQTRIPAARAANIIASVLEFRRLVERQELKPVSNYAEKLALGIALKRSQTGPATAFISKDMQYVRSNSF